MASDDEVQPPERPQRAEWVEPRLEVFLIAETESGGTTPISDAASAFS